MAPGLVPSGGGKVGEGEEGGGRRERGGGEEIAVICVHNQQLKYAYLHFDIIIRRLNVCRLVLQTLGCKDFQTLLASEASLRIYIRI